MWMDAVTDALPEEISLACTSVEDLSQVSSCTSE